MKLFAFAKIIGNRSCPNLSGNVRFYNVGKQGVLMEAEVNGLPDMNSTIGSHFYGFHIHEFGDCSLPFDKTGEHYNPKGQPHPYHAGDLPSLLGSDGYAYTSFYTNRVNADELIGKSIVIHSNADDFTTQPSGNAGEKIGCGVIKALG